MKECRKQYALLRAGVMIRRTRPLRRDSAHRFNNSKALTFFELLISVTILATGMVMVYRALLLSLNYQDYLTYRLYAGNLMEHKIAVIQRSFFDNDRVSSVFNEENKETALNNKKINFQFSYNVKNFDDLEKIFQLDATLSWVDHGRSFHLTRSAYISQL